MKILYLDTSSSYLYFGVVENDKLLFEVKEKLSTDLSKYALAKIVEKFEEYKIKPIDIKKIILVNGPGSFTGIRIGVTIAKTYAWGLNIPIITLSSLEAMAISTEKTTDYIVPLIDARRGYVYAGIYNDRNEIILSDQYINLNTLKIAISELSGSVKYTTNDTFTDLESTSYDPDILEIVKMCNDKEPTNPHSIDANYLKKTEAEEKLSQ